MAAIERLVAASEALRKTDLKGQSATLAQMVRFSACSCSLARPPTQLTLCHAVSQGGLVELGVKQLVGVFSKWARETSPTVDAGKLFDRGASVLLDLPIVLVLPS